MRKSRVQDANPKQNFNTNTKPIPIFKTHCYYPKMKQKGLKTCASILSHIFIYIARIVSRDKIIKLRKDVYFYRKELYII